MDYEKLYQGKNDSYYQNSRPEILPFIPLGIQTALDIGCGNGAFGELFKTQRSCTVWGIEPNKTAAQEANGKIDNVINALFSRDMPELANKRFDVIFFNDVLEHLVNPAEVLEDCKNFLSPNGYIIASIPNIRYYRAMISLIKHKDFKYEEFGVMDKTHLRFFTKKSMLRLFESNGFKIIKSEGINTPPAPAFLKFFNFITFGTQEDVKYPQYLIVAAIN